MHLRFSLLTALLALQFTPSLWAQKTESARFKTVDGVNIYGTYYPSNRRNAPVVLLLHALGEDSSKKGMTTLGEELSAKGYAVLAFDFRGHGRSTSVEPAEFWYSGAAPRNTLNTSSYIKGQVGRDTIDFKDFNPSYYTVLINDIAAARGYLDRKNDTGACNTNNLIVIGAEDGGTLGAIWINSECYRHRFYPATTTFPIQPPKLEKQSEGEGIICGIWLSLSPKLGGRDISMPQTLALPARTRATPMVFIYGDGDELGTKFAKYCEKNLVTYEDGKDGKQKSDNYKYTLTVGVPGNVKGANLISKNITEGLVKYLDSMIQDKGREWQQKDYRDAQYYWVFGNLPTQWVPAKVLMGETNLLYSTYTNSRFVYYGR
jgi:hypothetical protein